MTDVATGAATDEINYEVRGAASDEELTALHRAAFGHDGPVIAWNERLADHSITWITARDADRLVGFVNVVGDGGAHAILLDTSVAPDRQGSGIGRKLVETAADEATRLGCRWLHADYEPQLVAFYETACGMRPTHAGLLPLAQ